MFILFLLFQLPSNFFAQHCPNGTSGNATWTCGYDSWVGKSPDFSDCTTLDLGDFNSELNATESNPNEVIDEVNDVIDDTEDDLSSGDIIGLISLVGNAIAVR